MTEPVLKWPGGKRHLLDTLLEYVPSSYDRYIEPFVGGGALFFELEPDHSVINDVNTRLASMYHQIKEQPDDVIDVCREMACPYSDPDLSLPHANKDHKGRNIDQYYYQQRAIFNRRPHGLDVDPVREAATFLYLNRFCFNGLYRENQNGHFNVSLGDKRMEDTGWPYEDRIRRAHNCLADASIKNRDFEDLLRQHADGGDFVYADPPYKPSDGEFTNYSCDDFDQDDQERLLEVALDLNERGVHLLLSNSGAAFDMYTSHDCFDVIDVDTQYRISKYEHTEASEIIVTNIDLEDRQVDTVADAFDFIE